MNNNIYAYTETNGKSYPGYISLNEREGKFYLTVRGTGMQCGQEIEVSAKELRKFEEAISDKVAVYPRSDVEFLTFPEFDGKY